MPPLTTRETQVLEQIVQGLRSKEIAQRLGLSHRTIDVYRSSILHKMGARNTVDLVRKTLTSADPVGVSTAPSRRTGSAGSFLPGRFN